MNERIDQPDEPASVSDRTWKRRIGRWLLLYVITPYIAVTLIFTIFQRRLLYPATRTDRLSAARVSGDAAMEDVELHVAGGRVLHGWYFRSDATADRRPLIVYFPGNAGCRRDRIHECHEFNQIGCDVLLFDYRGYGDNPGSPGEETLAADARRIWMFALSELDADPEEIIFFGESLGGAVAVRLAAELSVAGTPPAGLLLNSTFASLPQTVAWHYPAFPFQFLLLDRYPSASRIPHVTCPLLQFHGTEDEFVPVEHGRELFNAAPTHSTNGIQKRFIVIEGGTHNSIPVSRLRDELIVFLKQVGQDAGQQGGRDAR